MCAVYSNILLMHQAELKAPFGFLTIVYLSIKTNKYICFVCEEH